MFPKHVIGLHAPVVHVLYGILKNSVLKTVSFRGHIVILLFIGKYKNLVTLCYLSLGHPVF